MNLRSVSLALGVVAALLSVTPDARAQPSDALSPGFTLGIAYTPDDDLTGIGWHAGGTLDRLVGKVCELRGSVGVISLEGDIQGQQPNAAYAYLIAEVLAADLFSPTGGIGLYYVDLEAPLVADDQRDFELGVNGGVRFLIPDSNHRERGFTIDAKAHAVFGDGPSLLLTLGAGLVF